MTWVKICGITNLEDARAALDAGADAVGFVFYDRSPRKMTAAAVAEITSDLTPEVETVGVFVEHSPSDMIDTVRATGLNAVQWHLTHATRSTGTSAEESRSAACSIGDLKMYWVLPASEFNWVPSTVRPPLAGIFLDSGTVEQPGGTGKTWDWAGSKRLVEDISRDVNVIIAGGLTPSNVGEAIRTLRPYGVDVSSGVESKPGKKDPEKVRAFIRAVREADKAA